MIPSSSFSPFHACVIRGMFALCAALTFSTAWAADVVAFTDAQHPLAHAEAARVVLLDAPAGLEAELGAHLPANPAQAEAMVRQRLAEGGERGPRRLASAYLGVVDASGLGVAKVPAVVVDRRYVVYGDPDVARAVARIRAYRSERP